MYSWRNVRILSKSLTLPARVHLGAFSCLYSTSLDSSHELFLKRCTDLIERRGHRFIHLGETVIDSEGNPEFFDITYGWPIRYYCKCNFSDNPVFSDEIKAFEVIHIIFGLSIEITEIMLYSSDKRRLF